MLKAAKDDSVPSADRNDSSAAPELVRAREHFDARRWVDAFEAFSAADARSPLALADLEKLALSAGLASRDDALLRANERIYGIHSEAGNCEGAARWAFWTAFRLGGMGEVARANGWFARAQRLVEQLGGECAVTGYLLLPAIRRHMQQCEYDAALRVAKDAVAIGERFAEPDLVNFARHAQGRALVLLGKVEEGLGLLDEVMVSVVAGELSPIMTGVVYCAVIDTCHQACALHRAREWTNAFAVWCEAQPQAANFGGICLAHRAEILSLGGAWSEAMDEMRDAEQAPSRAKPVTAEVLYQRAEIHRLRGEFALAEEAYRVASEYGRDPQPGLALLRVAQGRPDAAATAMRRVIGATTAPLERARLLPAHVEISLAAGDMDAARAGAEELVQIAAGAGGEVLEAMAAHARGAVALASGDAQAAAPCLRRAFAVWQRIGAPYIAARIRVSLSRACRELGDHDGAELELSAARQVFERLGAAHDLGRLDDPPEPASEHGLTVRELEVLRLLATGMTNKAISLQLFLSEKTVDRHVSNIFSKTGVNSRAAATAFAYERGIVRTSHG